VCGGCARRSGPPVSSISLGRKVARRTVKFHRLAYVLASFIASLAACNTTQVSEDYFEPSGAGQLVSRRGALSSPSTELVVSAPHMRRIAIAGWPKMPGTDSVGVTICVWLEPQDNVAVDVPLDLIRTLEPGSGTQVPFELANGVSQYHPTWDASDYGVMALVPGRVYGATKASPRALFPERRLEHKYCAVARTHAEQFTVAFGQLTIDGTEFSMPPVKFSRRNGRFTYGVSPS